MTEMVLGVRSSAWSKRGLTLAQQLEKIASHGFKFVNIIFDPVRAQERADAKKALDDLGLYSDQMGVDVSSYNSKAGPDSWNLWRASRPGWAWTSSPTSNVLVKRGSLESSDPLVS